jgi:hypothetical protein
MNLPNMMSDNSKLISKLDEIITMQTKLENDVAILKGEGGRPTNGGDGDQARKRRNTTLARGPSERSLSRKSSVRGVDDVEEVGELTPVMTGDYLVLQDLGTLSPGFVTGDAAFRRCGIQKLPNNNRPSLEYDDYVFQVFPALVYRSKQEISNKKLARTASFTQIRRQSTGGVNGASAAQTEREQEDKLLEERSLHEEKLNKTVINDVLNGSRREPLRYGQLIQLRHVKSGQFISCHQTAAMKDPACRKVSLREGSIAAQFALLPCYKAQTEGSVVFYTHSIKLGSVKLTGMFLHASQAVYEDVVDPLNESLPRCLRTEMTYELNASAKFTTFVIRKFASYEPGSHVNMKSVFTPFRLYHSQSESFVIASCNADKNVGCNVEKETIRKPVFKMEEVIGSASSSSDSAAIDGSSSSFHTMLPLHIPYLRNIDHDAGDEPDPTDPRNHITKSVWVFEALTRTSSSTIRWGEQVRIRHLPSGRYLCVDLSAPTHSVPPREKWYRTYLIDDPTDNEDLLEDSPFGTFGLNESSIFRVECDGASGSSIPLYDSNVRVEFRPEHSSMRLFLHNSEMKKPPQLNQGANSGSHSSTSHVSLMLVFSTQRSAQDTLKLMPISHEEALSIFRAKGFIPPSLAYATRLANSGQLLPDLEKYTETMNHLINIISFQSKGKSELPAIDWIKKANSMLPSAFSALFEGEPSELSQRISRDLKLLDSVFLMGLAPYQRLSDPFPREDMMEAAGIQKLVHVAMQRMFARNVQSQLYFGRRSAQSGKLLQGGASPNAMPWIEIIKLQLEDPLGSAVSLSKLLSSNGQLLEEHATPPMVLEFARMIRELGPQPRLVNFFEAICASGDSPVKSNQEMILRMTWRLPEDRAKLYLEVESVPEPVLKKLNVKITKYDKVKRLPGGDLNDGSIVKTPTTKSSDAPAAYLGKGEADAGFPPVFVRWSGNPSWTPKMDTFLFWSPDQMVQPLTTVNFNGRLLVRIEEFCWVLEPEMLCESIIGESWKSFQKKLDSEDDAGKDLRERFKRQEQLATYFIAEIKMLSKLGYGRSYNCINMLEESFSYVMLISMLKNTHLPCILRGVTLDLLRVLYLDRFPQLPNCARPSIPEMLWVYEAPDMSQDDLVATPVIQPITLRLPKKTSPLALPCFQIPKAHKLSQDPNPLFSFPDHFKFFLLRTACNDIIASFASGRINHNNKNMNQLASATVKVISDLLSFGFQSSYEKINGMVKGLVRLLDGRNDVRNLEISDDDYDPDEEPFDPFKDRFELTTNSPGVTSVKVVVLDVLISVSDFRTQFRLGKMMQIFKEYTEDRRQLRELKYFHSLVENLDEASYDGFLEEQLFKQFEELFTTGDGKLLDFEELSGQPLNTILLDCLMYQDDALHAKALELLERTFTQRKRLINAVEDVILLHRAPYYAQLNAEIGYLVYLLRSTEVWAVSSRIAGPFDEKKKKEFYEMCDKVIEYLHVPSEKVDFKDGKSKMADVSNEGNLFPNLVGGFPGVNLPFELSVRESAAASPSPNLPNRMNNNTMIEGGSHNSVSRSPLTNFHEDPKGQGIELKSYLEKDGDDDDDDKGGNDKPVPEHQDVLRAMNLQLALTKALGIDYNLAFKGSICSPEDKVTSRDIHIGALRKVIEMLTDFVSGNEKNQEIIFMTSLSDLRRHLGDLKIPQNLPKAFTENSELKSQLVTQPGLNSESVIIECLKGNFRLCSEEIPRALFEEFGELLNNEPEPSESYLLDFFKIAIQPEPGIDGLFRNQESTLDVLLSPKYDNIRQAMEGCFDINGQPLPIKSQNILNVLSACIMNQNGITSSRLQANGYSIDVTINAMSKCLDGLTRNEEEECVFDPSAPPSSSTSTPTEAEQGLSHISSFTIQGDAERKKQEEALLNNDHFTSLVEFLAHQLRCLVIDPRLYRNHDMWRVLSDAIGSLLSGFANDIEKPYGSIYNKVVKATPFIIPALRIVHDFVTGAKLMGASDSMATYDAPLKGDPRKVPTSIFASLKRIRAVLDHADNSRKEALPNELLAIQESLLIAARKLQYTLVPGSQDKNEEDVDIMLHKDEVQGGGRTTTDQGGGGGGGLRGSVATRMLNKRQSIDDDNITAAMGGGHAKDSINLEMETPAQLLSHFVEALSLNRKIQEKLLARRFEFLSILENAEKKTRPFGEVDPDEENENEENVFDLIGAGAIGQGLGGAFAQVGNAVNTIGDAVGDVVQNVVDVVTQNGPEFMPPQFGVKITWDMIVDRLVKFAKAHNFDKDESNIIRVHHVFTNHILKARSIGNKVLETSDMDSEQIDAYREVQCQLNDKGVTEIALLAISTHTPGLRNTAAVSAIELLQELLYSGNVHVQEAVLTYIEVVDKDSRFLKHLRSRLQESTRIVRERGEQVRSGFVEMTRDQILEYEEAEQTLHLLSEMMEGHNLSLQNIIRTQPLQSADVDLLKMVVDLLDYEASQSHFLKRMGNTCVGLLVSTLDFIVESMQGPCDGNQLALVQSEATMAAVKNILQSNFNKRLDEPTKMKIKSKAILVIAASLEGRKDRVVHDFLAEQLEVAVLNKFASDATEFINDLSSNKDSDLFYQYDDNEKRDLIDEALQGLVALANIKTEMSLVPSFAAAERLALKQSMKKGQKRPQIDAEVKMMRSSVASVEVSWNDRIEFVSFPLPQETEYLSQLSKESFLETVDLSTHEKRMKELIRAEPNLTAEMQQVYHLAQKSSLYKFMHLHFQEIKMVQYALVLLLNLNVVMASYGANKESEPGGKEDLGYSSAFHAAFVGGMKKEYRTSLILTFVLGVPNFLGYFFIMAFMGITEVPIVIRLIDNTVKEKKLEAQNDAEVIYRDPGAFTWWGVTLIFNIVFIIQHQAAYPHDRQPALYLFLVFGINLPWTLLCIRNYILVADTPQTRLFCIAFDTLVTKPFFRNQTLLVFCSINGFRFSSYFTLMLLDVVNISATIQSLVKSVTTPAPQLGIVAYLFVIMVIIYASFGLDFFEDFFIYDSDYDDDADDLTGPNPYGCHSVVACFWLIMYKGVPAGTLDEVLDVIDNRDSLYLGRVLFDLSFFVIVGIFLFNIITGLMVDTFSALREDAQDRADQLANECYVCGFTRTAYDDIGMLSPSFDQHKDRNHYIWNYLYFIQYLQEKDQTEFSGVESYVYSMLQSKSQDWLPARTSFAAQNHGITNDDDLATKQMEQRLSQKIETSFHNVEKKFSDFEVQMGRLGEMVEMVSDKS